MTRFERFVLRLASSDGWGPLIGFILVLGFWIAVAVVLSGDLR